MGAKEGSAGGPRVLTVAGGGRRRKGGAPAASTALSHPSLRHVEDMALVSSATSAPNEGESGEVGEGGQSQARSSLQTSKEQGTERRESQLGEGSSNEDSRRSSGVDSVEQSSGPVNRDKDMGDGTRRKLRCPPPPALAEALAVERGASRSTTISQV